MTNWNMNPDWAKLQPGDTVNGFVFTGQNGAQRKDPALWKPLTGEDFINSLPPDEAGAVKAYASGKWPFPQGFALKAPVLQRLIAEAQRYDPTFDAASFPARQATRKAYTSGPQEQNLINLNQAIGHAFDLVGDIPKVAGYGEGSPDSVLNTVATNTGLATTLNSAVNTYESGKGDPAQSSYDANVLALGTELAAVFKGKGASAESEIQAFKQAFSKNASTAQKYATIRRVTDLLRSRLNELGQQYVQGMGTTAQGITLLNPQAQQAFDYLSKVGTDPNLKMPDIQPADIQIGVMDKNGNMLLNDDGAPVGQPKGAPRLPLGTGGLGTPRPTPQQAQPSKAAAVPSPASKIPVPAAAIQMLRANPQLAPAFDQKYGTGASRAALGAQ